jgi:hypothetical protein
MKWIVLALLVLAPSLASAAPSNCTSYVDRTAPSADRTLLWTLALAGSPAACMKVAVGQTVTWSGSFTSHPLLADGGTTPNPIPNHDAAGNVTFTAPGTYGYICEIHAVMTGAIMVVPTATASVPALGWPAAVALVLALVTLGVSLRRRASRELPAAP